MTDESALLVAAEAASQQMHVGDAPGGYTLDTPGGNHQGEDPDATIETVATNAATQERSATNDTTLDPDVTCDQGASVSRAAIDTEATTLDQDSTIVGKLAFGLDAARTNLSEVSFWIITFNNYNLSWPHKLFILNELWFF